MAGKRKLPNVGDIFAFKLDNGLFGACLIIKTPNKRDARLWGDEMVAVACSAWIGKKLPRIDTPGLTEVLRLTHHNHSGQPEVLWIDEPAPRRFKLIGTVQPPNTVRKLQCHNFGGWDSIKIQPLMQWRWDNERKLVQAEDREADENEEARMLAAFVAREDFLSNITLDDLLKRRFLVSWTGFVGPEPRRLSRKTLRDTVRELATVGKRSRRDKRRNILKGCVESLNRLDRKYQFIETVERDELCKELENIFHACGLGDEANLVDNWKAW